MDADLASIDVAHEVMILDVDMLSAWTHLGHFGDFDRSAVVLKHSAMNLWLKCGDVETMLLKLLEQLHDRDRCSKCIGQANELAFGGAQGDFGLQLRSPNDRTVSVVDNVAVT